MNTILTASDSDDALKQINDLRLKNKGMWIFVEIELWNKIILVKSYDLYLQIIRVSGSEINYGGHCNNVREWKDKVNQAIASIE